MKQEFLTLKWAITKQFQEYILWKPFVVKTNKNPLTYIMTTPNLDAIQDWWIESLAPYTFSIKYLKGCNNVARDVLSCVTSKLNTETVKSILDDATMGTTKKADAHDPTVAKADEIIHKPFQETAILAQAACIDLHVTGWVTAQQEDPTLKAVVRWISDQKVQDLKHLMGDDANTEEGKTFLLERKKWALYLGALYHCNNPWWTGGSFVVPGPQGSLGSCHEWMSLQCQAQGQHQTLGFLNDWFWCLDAEDN